MSESKFGSDDGLEIDIDTLIRENAQAVADYELQDSDESNNQDLQDRQALRRVNGLSTELQDVSDAEYRQLRLEKVVLVGVWTEGTAKDADNSLKELAALAETAGSQVMDALIQRRDKPDPATFIGSGKVTEVRQAVVATGADTVICDGELSPAQLRTLEQKVKVKVVDRTALILDIFAQHAKSREGKAQVELAQMSYMLPRLRGWGESLSRQSGGTGGIGGLVTVNAVGNITTTATNSAGIIAQSVGGGGGNGSTGTGGNGGSGVVIVSYASTLKAATTTGTVTATTSSASSFVGTYGIARATRA